MASKAATPPAARSRRARFLWLALGWFCVGLGAIGVVLPIMPTVPFLIVAGWAFGKGSERWRDWLWNHPLYGPHLRRWHEHRVVPPIAKVFTVIAFIGSLGLMTLIGVPLFGLAAAAAVFVGIASYVVSRPSHPPRERRGAPRTP